MLIARVVIRVVRDDADRATGEPYRQHLTATAWTSMHELMARMGDASTRAALVYLYDTDDRQHIIAAAVITSLGCSSPAGHAGM